MNAAGFPLLSLLTFLPLVGAVIIMSVRGDEAVVAQNARWTALWTSLIVLALSLILWTGFDRASADFQFVEQLDWLPEYGLAYRMGVDGIAVLFVLLSTLLTPICILASWDAIQNRVREYMIAFLVLETMMVGMFAAMDFIVFYIFFEGVLLPMFLIIGVWGGPRRVYAAFKFFLYTLLGSVLMLLAILYLWYNAGTTDIPALVAHGVPRGVQGWIFLAFLASFAVKVPMWPVHTWLPDAHVEAPTAGSVILAGVLLKMGAYGFLRFSLPLLPVASVEFAPLIFLLSIVAVIYTSLVALAQEDMKKLIAYSSVAHMGIVTLGIFTFNAQGLSGAIFTMLSHGVVSGALTMPTNVESTVAQSPTATAAPIAWRPAASRSCSASATSASCAASEADAMLRTASERASEQARLGHAQPFRRQRLQGHGNLCRARKHAPGVGSLRPPNSHRGACAACASPGDACAARCALSWRRATRAGAYRRGRGTAAARRRRVSTTRARHANGRGAVRLTRPRLNSASDASSATPHAPAAAHATRIMQCKVHGAAARRLHGARHARH